MKRFTRNPLGTLLGLGGAVGVGMLSFAPGANEAPEVGLLEPLVVPPAERVEVRELGAGQTLGGILAGALDGVEQQSLLLAFREQASPRRMRVGTEVTLRYPGEGGALRGIDVALNPDVTVRLTRDALGWHSERVRTPTWVDTLYVAGEIEDVLWNAVVGHEGLADVPVRDRVLLLHHLDQVFQWQVDFSRQIRSGDGFRFAFERHVRPDGSMRTGHLLAAELVNQGASIHAVWFDPDEDGRGDYFDLDGESVRRAFLMKPLEFRRISSRFSRSRFHPVLKRWRAHRGTDYAADRGTPIMTTADGVVQHRGPKGGLGNAVIIRHSNGFVTRYGHMSRFQPGIGVGSRVKQGDVIGYVGATGLATAPHLHYEMWRHGQAIDPLAVDLPSGDPVPEGSLRRWNAESNQRMALLERLPLPTAARLALRDAERRAAEARAEAEQAAGPDRDRQDD